MFYGNRPDVPPVQSFFAIILCDWATLIIIYAKRFSYTAKTVMVGLYWAKISISIAKIERFSLDDEHETDFCFLDQLQYCPRPTKPAKLTPELYAI